jgi:hypothetical protein
MRCEDVTPQLADYLTGLLPDPPSGEVSRHIAVCDDCRKELEDLHDTWRLLGELPAPAPDSSAMRARFDAVLAQHVADSGSAATGSPMWSRRSHWPWALGASAATLVLGVLLGRLTAPDSASRDLASLRDELRETRVLVGLSLMQQTSASERLRGVSWSSGIDRPGDELVEALVGALRHDPSDNVRLATVDALRRFADRDAVRRGAIEALPQQTSPLVQVALIDFVVEVNDRNAIETLRRLSSDPMVNEAVRARAALALERIG